MSRKAKAVLAIFALLISQPALAQALRLRTKMPRPATAAKASTEKPSPWSLSLDYSALTDYADSRSPRGYTNSFAAGLGYQLNKNWSLGFLAALRAESVNGQIHKGTEQSYEEVVSASTQAEVTYEEQFNKVHRYSFFMHGEPLWDEASRLEGYKGVVGGGADLSLSFFNSVYTLTNFLDVSELINTFKYSTSLTYNPDYFVTYKFINSFKIYRGLKFSVSFGAKATHHLDGFWGYTYQTAFSISQTWGAFRVALAYDSGGFTDNGEVRLWYLNEYRRIGRFVVSYAF